MGPVTALTDPNFLHRGERAHLGHGLWSRRRTAPACGLHELPPLDVVGLPHRGETAHLRGRADPATAAPGDGRGMTPAGMVGATSGYGRSVSYRGPDSLWLVRHGQSTGNVANDEARRAGAELLDLERDADVPLSDLGAQQADAVGKWFAALPPDRRPTLGLSSPYRRAHDTARRVLEHLPEVPLRVDERLRDRELGILDLHTAAGIAARFPQEAARRRHLGRFYHRPPGGESWADVALRLRALLTDPMLDLDGRRVVVVSHEAPIHLVRYILERMDEAEVLAALRDAPIANCSLTCFERPAPGEPLRVVDVGLVDPLPRNDVPTTKEPRVSSDEK
ncbi:histidine phosphatase family protein [Pseudonocardia sp.]|uniref:histidine phosphatase family protein n=1 Tax=Pseudonocardia sp. TaxID=60912 RepID=UPI003D0D0F00